MNGKFYYLYPSQAETTQLNQTLDGINYAKRLAKKIVVNTTFVRVAPLKFLTVAPKGIP